MRKTILAGLGLALAVTFAPAAADPEGCVTLPELESQGETCQYTANGEGQWFAVTPNGYSVVILRPNEHGDVDTITVVSNPSLSVPSTGAIPSQAGDTVVVTQDRDCVPVAEVCGTGGIVGAGDPDM